MIKLSLYCVFLGASLINVAHAAETKECKMVACMAGMVGGGYGNVSGSDCKGVISDFFSIKDKKHGDFLPDHSAKKRMKKLKQCPDELAQNSNAISDIINKFGRVESL